MKHKREREAEEYRWVKIEVYIPEEYLDRLQAALHEIGACREGEYDHVAHITPGIGKWRALKDAKPFLGEPGKIYSGSESRLEFRCPLRQAQKAVEVIEEAHPYEQPVINVIPLFNHRFKMKESGLFPDA